MRLSDLLTLEAVSEDGQSLGEVHDVRFRSSDDSPQNWTLDSLIVGPSSFAVRLGYSRGLVHGPWLLRTLFEWLARHGRRIPWSAVTDVGDSRVTVAGRPEDFGHPTDEEPS